MDRVTGRHNTYVAYLLRLWQAGNRDGIPVWRASLENPHTGERLVFGTVEELFAFLIEAMGVCAARPDVSLDEGDTS